MDSEKFPIMPDLRDRYGINSIIILPGRNIKRKRPGINNKDFIFAK